MDARRANFKPTLKVNARNPGPVQIRFLEQGPEVHNFKVHEYKVPSQNGGNPYSKQFTCLSEVGQVCPGCQAGMKQKVRGVFNIIYRNRPQIQRGQDNKALKDAAGNYIIIGYQDEVVVANVGGPTAEMLRKADGTYHGLMSRDFVVQYSGDQFQSWNLAPALDGAGSSNPTPLSEADQVLLANKHNLDEYMKPPEQQEAAQIVARYGQNSGASPNAQPQQTLPQGNATAAGAGNGFTAGAAIPGAPVAGAFGAAQQAVAAPPAPPTAAPAQTVPAAAAAATDPGLQQPVVPVVNGDGTVTQGVPPEQVAQPAAPPAPPVAPPAPVPTQ